MRVHLFKLRSERRGEHVHTTVFSGVDGQTLANNGTLVQNIGEWQEFGGLLLIGSLSTKGRVEVIFEGDKEVVGNG